MFDCMFDCMQGLQRPLTPKSISEKLQSGYFLIAVWNMKSSGSFPPLFITLLSSAACSFISRGC